MPFANASTLLQLSMASFCCLLSHNYHSRSVTCFSWLTTEVISKMVHIHSLNAIYSERTLPATFSNHILLH